MKVLLPKLISKEKMGFVLWRLILDGVIIIQEKLHSSNKNKRASMFMKLDIQKAYAMTSWLEVLCKTLEAFRFSHQWIHLIYQCISITKISILINWTPKGIFDTSRGIRQGDPLSPFLYIIMAKAFSKEITKAYSDGKIRGITVTKFFF